MVIGYGYVHLITITITSYVPPVLLLILNLKLKKGTKTKHACRCRGTFDCFFATLFRSCLLWARPRQSEGEEVASVTWESGKLLLQTHIFTLQFLHSLHLHLHLQFLSIEHTNHPLHETPPPYHILRTSQPIHSWVMVTLNTLTETLRVPRLRKRADTVCQPRICTSCF